MLSLRVFVASLLLLGLVAFAQNESKRVWWVFLVKGDGPRPSDEKALQEMQKAHIDNFKRLSGEKKLLTAGPMQDSTQVKRGIVILTVGNKQQVEECFKPDPYIQNGIMKVEASEADVEFGRIETSKIDPNGIAENRIVIFTEGPEKLSDRAIRSARRARLEYLRTNGPKAGLAFYATFRNAKNLGGVALFRGTDDKAIQELLDNDLLVKSKVQIATKMPQWLSKGVLPENP